MDMQKYVVLHQKTIRSRAHDNPNRNLPGGRILLVLAAGISLQDQLATSRRAILGMDLRMGSLVRMLALSLRNGRLVLVEGEEVSEKMREEFELAYVANIQEHLGGPIPKGVLDEYVVRGSDGEYRSYQAQGAWWAWKASRESLVVQLPYVSVIFEGSDQDNDMIEACREAIHAAGVKTK